MGPIREKTRIVPKEIQFIIVMQPYLRSIIINLDRTSQIKTNRMDTRIILLVLRVIMGIPIQAEVLDCFTIMILCLMNIIKLMGATSAMELGTITISIMEHFTKALLSLHLDLITEELVDPPSKVQEII